MSISLDVIMSSTNHFFVIGQSEHADCNQGNCAYQWKLNEDLYFDGSEEPKVLEFGRYRERTKKQIKKRKFY
jgi:hypothetical protein